jgi:phthalate 4,5-dioxygenase
VLKTSENELLCRVEGDAAMGSMLARYWLPVGRSSELIADGPPRRLKLLGRRLVAFRDSGGQLGVMNENCPHRGASLALARNEHCALQCLYHGWRIDRTGTILETPSEPEDSTFKTKIRHIAYPVHESAGMVWTYLGPPEREPAPPAFEWTELPEEQVFLIKVRTRANWVQCLEGVIDSAHLMFLHSDFTRPDWARQAEAKDTGRAATEERVLGELNKARYEDYARLYAETTPYGFRYAAVRQPADGPRITKYVRTSHFVAPFFGFFPAPPGNGFMQAFVPIDDYNTWFYWVQYRVDGQPITPEMRRAALEFSGFVPGVDVDEDGHNIRTWDNMWLQDRGAMTRKETFSGISGINNEDFAIQESMGPLFDRSTEHLGTSDVAVIRMRKLMLASVRAWLDRGEEPLGLAEPFPLPRIRAGEGIIDQEQPWQTVGDWLDESATAIGAR